MLLFPSFRTGTVKLHHLTTPSGEESELNPSPVILTLEHLLAKNVLLPSLELLINFEEEMSEINKINNISS